MVEDNFFNALHSLKGDDLSLRVCVLVSTPLEVRLVERAIACEPSGLAGVDVWSWRTLAVELLEVFGLSGLRAATLSEVARFGIAPVLQELVASDDPAWLVKSAGHIPSEYRLARAFVRASELTTTTTEVLPLKHLDVILVRVEQTLEAEGFLLPGRAFTHAASVLARVAQSQPDSLARLIPAALVVGDENLLTPAVGQLRAAVTQQVQAVGVPAFTHQELPEHSPQVTRALITPNVSVEARVIGRQVYDWLESGVPPADIAVVTPSDARFQAVISHALLGYGIEHWVSLPQSSLASTRAAAVCIALAQSLDSMSGCLTCAQVLLQHTAGLSEVTAGGDGAHLVEHDCSGNYEFVSVVVQAVCGGPGRARVILESAAELNLQYGLRHWGSLLRWHLGDDDALSQVSARNAVAHASHVGPGRVRGAVARVSDSPELLEDMRDDLRALLLIFEPVLLGQVNNFIERFELVTQRARVNKWALKSAGIIRENLKGMDTVQAGRLFDTVERGVSTPISQMEKVGMGVGVYSVEHATSVSARHILWSGLAEGCAPVLTKVDPLVLGDADALHSHERAREQAAFALINRATQSVCSVSRVALGTRQQNIASRWFMQWSHSQQLGAAEVMHMREVESIDVISSTVQALVDYPKVIHGSTVDAAHNVAVAFVHAQDARDGDEARESDGLLGPLPHQENANEATWLDTQSLRRMLLDPDATGVTAKSVSPSALSAFVECPRKFFYRTVVGIGSSDEPSVETDAPANTWGSFVHSVLELVLTEAIALPAGEHAAFLVEQLVRLAPGYFPFYAGNHKMLDNRLHRQGRTLADTVNWEDLADLGSPRAEEHLTGIFHDITIAGYADFTWPTLIVDVKTGKKKTGTDLLRDQVQVQSYSAMAMASPSGLGPVSGELWYVSDRGPGVVSTDTATSATSHNSLFHTAVGSLSHALIQGEFPAVGDNAGGDKSPCTYCDFNEICPKDVGDRWDTLRSHSRFSNVYPISVHDVDASIDARDGSTEENR